MDRLYKVSSMRHQPLITICWILSLAAIIGGLWVLSPWLILTSPTGSSAIYHHVASDFGLYTLAIAAIISGIMMVYGIVKNKISWLRRGLLVNLILRIYTFLIAFLIYGVPSNWISSLTLLAITLVVFLVLRGDE